MPTRTKHELRTRVRTYSMSPGIPDEYFTTEEIAEDIRRGPRTILRLIKEGKLEARKQGRDWLITREAIQKYMNGLPIGVPQEESD